LQEDGDQLGTEFVGGKRTAQFAGNGEGDDPGFFGEDHDDRVGFVAEAERRAMPQAKVALESFGLGEGKDGCGDGNAVLDDDDAAVVERGLGKEDGGEEVVADFGVENGAGFAGWFVGDFALESDEGTVAILLHLFERANDDFDDLSLLAASAEKRAAADLGKIRRSSGWKIMTSAVISTAGEKLSSLKMTVRFKTTERSESVARMTPKPARTRAPRVPRNSFHT